MELHPDAVDNGKKGDPSNARATDTQLLPSPKPLPLSSFLHLLLLWEKGHYGDSSSLPQLTPSPTASQMFYSWKRRGAVASSVKSCSMSIFSTCWLTKRWCPWPQYTVPTPWLTWGWGWRSDWSSSLSHSLPRFSHKENTYALLQARDGLSDLSQFLPTTGFQRAIFTVVWTELQSNRRLLECVEPNENVYGCLGAPDHLWLSFWSHSALLGLFLWVFLSAKCLFIFLSLFTPLAFLSCFPSQLGSTYKGRAASFFLVPTTVAHIQSGRAGWMSACCLLARWAIGQMT